MLFLPSGRTVFGLLGSLLALLLYNEFLVYYIVLLQCTWPNLQVGDADFKVQEGRAEPVKAIFLADTHLLGSRLGNWFDKLRREWQMERAFQTSLFIHSPDVAFILGDLFDEGKWCNDAEFHYYISRFQDMFRHSSDTELQVVVGNHDIGFHYMIDEHKRRRFSSAFSAPPVRVLRIKGNIFILLNSMAFEGDSCEMCVEADTKLRQISRSLDCAQGRLDEQYCREEQKYLYSRPILLQHFPMYRKSDSNCTGPDAAPPEEKNIPFKQRWDCLSKEASEKVFHLLKPRLIISAHTHHFCHRHHPDGTPEWTVPSFSWRNKNNPSFLLARISNNNYSIKKCYLPTETTVIWTYIVGAVAIFLWFLMPSRIYTTITRSRAVKEH